MTAPIGKSRILGHSISTLHEWSGHDCVHRCAMRSTTKIELCSSADQLSPNSFRLGAIAPTSSRIRCARRRRVGVGRSPATSTIGDEVSRRRHRRTRQEVVGARVIAVTFLNAAERRELMVRAQMKFEQTRARQHAVVDAFPVSAVALATRLQVPSNMDVFRPLSEANCMCLDAAMLGT